MSRIKPEQEIKYICNVIDKNIEAHQILKDRGLLSENILAQLRNLTEDIAIFVNNEDNSLELDSHYNNVEDSMKYVSTIHKYKYINIFHKYLQSTTSHYTPSESDAESLMLFYFRYICMMKQTLGDYGITVLNKLDDFPIYEDNLTKEHYKKICEVIEQVNEKENKYLRQGRFYINKCRPIYSNGRLYYEYTLTKATNYNNKFERILMYSKFFIPDNYSIKLSYVEKNIEIFSSVSKIKVIDNYVISIRPCELKNIGSIIGLNYNISDEYSEYSNLMKILKSEEMNILELLLKENELFNYYIEEIKLKSKNNNISNILINLRNRLLIEQRGNNVLRYLLVKMENQTIRDQICDEPNKHLSQLYLINKSIPFDSMPYAMALYNHNISWIHLINSIPFEDRYFELLGRYVKNNCESNNVLYTPCKEVEKYGNVSQLIEQYNRALVNYGIDIRERNILIKEHDNIYIKSYEVAPIKIINEIKEYITKPNNDIISCIRAEDLYLTEDLSEDKRKILNNIFEEEKLCIIHGPAGTGKTKMLEILARIFYNYNKIFLSTTNTSVENLKSRISKYDIFNSTFETIATYNKYDENNYDILIVDECSTISNEDMLKILEHQKYKLIIFSGDVFQIESIKYGNWFSIAYNIFKDKIVYELINTNRTEDQDLLELWKMIRDNDEQARNKISNQEYSSPIDLTIFDQKDKDEIILCLNYDGLYGINNINKILQVKNDNKEFIIGVDSYKIEDPIVFNDCPRFKDLYNNLKGTIKEIEEDEENDCVWFTILVDEQLSNSQGNYEIIKYQNEKTLIKLYVNNFKDTNEDETGYEHIIPFNLAYAISIHKAQGLEYKSVKIIITSNVENDITKNIFYTAITRAKKYLKIFWSQETENKIFENMKIRTNSRDISILKTKMNLN